jgi:hypothetical protein
MSPIEGKNGMATENRKTNGLGVGLEEELEGAMKDVTL